MKTYPGTPEKIIPATPPITVNDCPECGREVEQVDTWCNPRPKVDLIPMWEGGPVWEREDPYGAKEPGPYHVQLGPCGCRVSRVERHVTEAAITVSFVPLTGEDVDDWLRDRADEIEAGS